MTSAMLACWIFGSIAAWICFHPHENENEDPDPSDDMAELCADETTIIDVLVNDVDPEDDVLIIGEIEGRSLEDGESIEIESGAKLTLVNNKIQYDPNGAFDNVEICDVIEDEFNYTVNDGRGGEVEATVKVGVLGSKPTVELLDDLEIPETANVKVSGDELIFDYQVQILGTDTPLDGIYLDAYCVDQEAPFPDLNSENYIQADVHVFGSDEINYTAFDPNNPSPDLSEDLDNIGWLLNENFGAKGYTQAEIQSVIWKLVDPDSSIEAIMLEATGNGDLGSIDSANDLYEKALTEGEGYTPKEGDTVAIILNPADSEKGNIQPFVIGIELDLLCECKLYDQVYA